MQVMVDTNLCPNIQLSFKKEPSVSELDAVQEAWRAEWVQKFKLRRLSHQPGYVPPMESPSEIPSAEDTHSRNRGTLRNRNRLFAALQRKADKREEEYGTLQMHKKQHMGAKVEWYRMRRPEFRARMRKRRETAEKEFMGVLEHCSEALRDGIRLVLVEQLGVEDMAHVRECTEDEFRKANMCILRFLWNNHLFS